MQIKKLEKGSNL